jgi:tetratricopeptide (TPR) repeat protein
VFWIDASSRESAKQSFSEIAKIGGVEPNELAAKNWLSNLVHSWLLLIDNADDPDISVEDYFPEGERGFILVTTRVPENKMHGNIGSRFYQFEKLESEAANELLLRAAGISCPWDLPVRESAALITSTLGCLPLALIHAGKAIVNRLCELGNYLHFYKKNWERIRQARKASGYSLDDDTNMNVYSSYEVIYRRLEKRTTQEAKDAIELLKVFSFLHREDIRVDILLAAAKNPWLELEAQEREKQGEKNTKIVPKRKSWTQFLRELGFGIQETVFMDRSPPVLPSMLRDVEGLASLEDFEFRLRAALHVLTQWSLITHHDESKTYSMHPLVHIWVRERPQMTIGEHAIWCQAATTTLVQAISLPSSSGGSTKEDAALQRGLLLHVIHLRARQAETQDKIANNQKLRKRPWPPLGPKFNRRQAIQLIKFSYIYFLCGAWKEAEQLQLVVKNYICPRLGMEHPTSMRVSRFLATTYWHQGRANEAADLNHQVLQAALNSLGPEHPTTLQIMTQLGVIRRLQGRFPDSEELHRNAIEGMIKTLGEDHDDALLAIDNLGQTLWCMFRFEEAKEQHLKAIAGMEIHPKMGPTHEKTLAAKENLAMTYREIGGELLNDAHRLMEDVLKQRHNTLGKEQPYTLMAMCNLARVKHSMNKLEEAETLLLKAIPVAERNLGKNHTGVTMGKFRLAQIRASQKRYNEAEEIFKYVLEPQRYTTMAREEGHVKGDHPDRIFAMFSFVEFYEQQGKIQEAISTCEELAYVLRESVHPIADKVRDKQKKLDALRLRNTENTVHVMDMTGMPQALQ